MMSDNFDSVVWEAKRRPADSWQYFWPGVAVFLIFLTVIPCGSALGQEKIVPYVAKSWIPEVWVSDPPDGCPFKLSAVYTGLAFTGNHVSYTDADTWYPSWASNGNMYSGWTDGEINLESVHSSGGAKACTGNAVIEGDDPMDLKITSLGSENASALPYAGRYPCANLVYNGIWYYGTYGVDFDPKPENQKYSWAVCGPLPGFRISRDYGKSWTPCPHTLNDPLFPESGKNGRQVKMGTPHFVDFGQNMEYSPDGKAYLIGHGAVDNDSLPRVANNSWVAGDAVYLARVSPSVETINNLPDYEFFSGYDDHGKPVWSHEFSRIRPVLEWNNHMGCATLTWNQPLKKYLMCVIDGWPGVSDMSTYILEADEITGPYRLITYMKNFGRQAYFAHIPSKFISDDGKSFWLSYSANFHMDYFGNRAVENPPGSRYAWDLQEVKLLSADEERSLRQKLKNGQPDPLKRDENLALHANITVSSAARKWRPFTELIQYFGTGAVDGEVGTGDDSKLHEWISDGEKNTAFLRLTWDKPVNVSKIWLFDRPSLKDQVVSGMLVFSDGSTAHVSELPNDAESAREINFPQKKIEWLSFIVTGVSETTTNAGLAEIAVFK